jgi:hypothetical protein
VSFIGAAQAKSLSGRIGKSGQIHTRISEDKETASGAPLAPEFEKSELADVLTFAAAEASLAENPTSAYSVCSPGRDRDYAKEGHCESDLQFKIYRFGGNYFFSGGLAAGAGDAQ